MALPIELLKRVTVVYTHANCPDGVASAMILKDAFRMLGTSPRIEFLVHGTPEHRKAGGENYARGDGWSLFCDIVPHPDVAGLLAKQPRTAIVLDHHKGAEELVRSFGELGVFADEKLEPGVSGAVLAFREVWKPIRLIDNTSRSETFDRVRSFAECVGARDTWQTKDPRFQRGQWISKMLMSKPASHWLTGTLVSAGAIPDAYGNVDGNRSPYLNDEEVHVGRALFEAHEEAVRQAVDQCVQFYVEKPEGELVGLYVFQEQACGFRLCSDVAEALRAPLPTPHEPGEQRVCHVVAGFSYVADKPGGAPRLLYSLRGLNGFDVAAFAKANGGGGHTAAAGFSIPIGEVGSRGTEPSPYGLIRERLAEFLTS